MPADDPLGTVHRDGGRVTLRYERALSHAPERVWRAITESEHLHHWLPCDIVGERRAGAPIRLAFWPEVTIRHGITDEPLAGTIHVWDPPRCFEWSWDTDLLRFELHPTDDGTLLVFTTVLGDTEVPPSSTAAGWHVCLALLRSSLDGRHSGGVADADTSTWESRYAGLLA